MNEKTQEYLVALCEKLGTTAEHVWAVLIKQAIIMGWMNAVLFVICIVFILATVLLCKSKRFLDYGDGCPLVVMVIFSCLFVLLAPIVFCEAFTCLLNPEYWALKQVLGK